jgi:hypothetical protein
MTHFDVVGGGVPGVQWKGGRGRFHEYSMYTENRKIPAQIANSRVNTQITVYK